MVITTSYSVKIKKYNKVLNETVIQYRKAVDFFISVAMNKWEEVSSLQGKLSQQRYIECCTHRTTSNPFPNYDFDSSFYKFPSYLRRAAITDALGVVSSYKKKNMKHENSSNKKQIPPPKAGNIFPAMFRYNCFVRTGTYTARIKVYIRNTWDWLDVNLKKGDVDYILNRCSSRNECTPVLRKRGKEWFLDFAFIEEIELSNTPLHKQVIVSVDLGLNTPCTCCVMTAEGTILDRKFLFLPRETDSLHHAINKIKKAQQHGATCTPRLWAIAKGINNGIAVKTANFIIDTAILWSADVIVFEHLNLSGKKTGSHKALIHHWKAKYVQSIVFQKAHRLTMRVRRVCAWGTSKLAYDGSGIVRRGINGNFSICKFQNGKIYNCDLSASYNIGARYFIKEILKSLPETIRLEVMAKVPSLSKRITCTLSTLHSLNAVLAEYDCLD